MEVQICVFLSFFVSFASLEIINGTVTEEKKEADLSAEHYKNDTLSVENCPENEEFRLCENCHLSCDNVTNQPVNICNNTCKKGCFCINGYVREKEGICKKDCGEFQKKELSPIPYQLSCGAHQVYDSCRRLEYTCSGTIIGDSGQCLAGCFCEHGFLKGPDGHCVLKNDCPKAEITLDHNEQSIEECQADEVFVWCGWCEGSCSDPVPHCPAGACTRACLCRPPLLRHYSGHCVEEQDCLPRKCADPNEEYVCRYGCEPRCKAYNCLRTHRCQLRCHCKRGLLRNNNEKCVTRDQCFVDNNTSINI